MVVNWVIVQCVFYYEIVGTQRFNSLDRIDYGSFYRGKEEKTCMYMQAGVKHYCLCWQVLKIVPRCSAAILLLGIVRYLQSHIRCVI